MKNIWIFRKSPMIEKKEELDSAMKRNGIVKILMMLEYESWSMLMSIPIYRKL
jgi:hypothetical protein